MPIADADSVTQATAIHEPTSDRSKKRLPSLPAGLADGLAAAAGLGAAAVAAAAAQVCLRGFRWEVSVPSCYVIPEKGHFWNSASVFVVSRNNPSRESSME
jgi:hypothetical protein